MNGTLRVLCKLSLLLFLSVSFFAKGESNFITDIDCTTPPDQDFGTYEDIDYGGSVSYQCITYTGSDAYVGIGDAVSQGISTSPVFSGSAVVMGGNTAGGYVAFKSTSSGNFKIVSFVSDFYGHSNGKMSEIYHIKGYDNGVEKISANDFQVTSSGSYGSGNAAVNWQREDYDTDGSNSGLLTFGSGWSNIDEIRFYPAEASPNNNLFIGLDNINFEEAVTTPATTVPTVTTSTVTAVTATAVTLSGEVTDDGGDAVTERGFVYSTSAAPTTANTKIQDESGMGTFSENITGLTAATTYYVRAYAINGEGTSYGDEESFTTSVSSSSNIITFDAESFTDGQEIPDNHNFSVNGKIFNVYAGTFDGGISGEGGIFYDPGDGSVSWNTFPTEFEDGGFITLDFTTDINRRWYDPEALIIKTTDGSPFKFTSFKSHDATWDSWGNYLKISGYKDGVLQGSESVIIVSNVEPYHSTVTLTDPIFGSVDEVRITLDKDNHPAYPYNGDTDMDGLYQSFDTFVIDNAVTSNSAPGELANTGASLDNGASHTITQSELEFTDSEQTDPADISYTIVVLPSHGIIKVGGLELTTGDEFSQQNINDGSLVYVHDGSSSISDGFQFDVTDGQGGTIENITFDFTIACALKASVIAQTNLACNGGSTGSVSVQTTGGTADYTYVWSNGSTTNNTSSVVNTINNLAAGAYSVTVTDANNCTATASTTLVQPTALSASIASTTDISCNGGSNGSATVSATGGTAPYSYSWSPAGGTAATASELAAGTYSVTVTDANNCTATASTTLVQPTALSASIASQTNVSCNGGANGAATVSAIGGTAPYSYAWSPAGGNAATANDLTAGTYSVTVTDDNACETTAEVTIQQPEVIKTSTEEEACGSYLWSNGNTYTESGIYTQMLQSKQGCDSIVELNLTIFPAIEVSFTNTDNVLTASGEGVIGFQWYNCDSQTNVEGADNATFTVSDLGMYAVIGTSGDGCVDTSDCATIDPTLGFNSFGSNDDVKLFPNPASDRLQIHFPDNTATVEVYNSNGMQLIFINDFNAGNELFLGRLESGIYHIKISTENNSWNKTILKQ